MNRSNLGAVRHSLLSAAVLAILAVPVSAQIVEKERTFADLTASHPCNAGLTDRNAIVTDCDAADDIGDGGGAFRCFAHCDGTAPWAAVSIGGGSGGTGDVLLAGDADGQTIQGFTGSSKARLALGEDTLDAYAGTIAQSHIGASATDALLEFGNADVDGSYKAKVSAAGLVLSTPSGVTKISVLDGALRLESGQTPPTNANDACTAGDTIDTATFHYFCAATNTWVRVAMATW